jgi:tetratricopeptide (TPR) repeat protein
MFLAGFLAVVAFNSHAAQRSTAQCAHLADSLFVLVDRRAPGAPALARRVATTCRSDFEVLFRSGRAINRITRFEHAAGDLALREAASLLLDRAVRLRRRNAAAWFEFGVAIKKRGGLQIDAQRAIERAFDLADRYPDSTSRDLLAEIQFQRARYLQDWVDRFRWLKDAAGLGVATPACSNLGLFCENYTRPREFNERLRDLAYVRVDVSVQRERMIRLYEQVLELDPSHVEAAERLGRELALGQEWELLGRLARRVDGRVPVPGFFKAVEALSAERVGQRVRAASLYTAAVAAMPDSLRRWFDHPPPGLDTIPDFWVRTRPLWLAPFDEPLLEYRTRLTLAFLVLRDREAEVAGPETPAGDALLRYGWPATITQLERDAGSLMSPIQMAAVIATALDCTPGDVGARDQGLPTCGQVDPGYTADPGGGRWLLWTYDEERPSFVFEQRPGRRVPRYVFDGAAEEHAVELRAASPFTFRSRVAPRAFRLPVQLARFKGNGPDETTVALHAVVAARQMELPPQDSVAVGLYLFRDTAGFPVVAQRRATYAAGEGIALSYSLALEPGRYAYSLEAWAEAFGAAATVRDSLPIRSWPDDSLTVSDLLVAHRVTSRVDGDPLTWRDLTIEPSRTLEVTPGASLWVVWEVYGARRDNRGNGRYDVAVALRDAGARSLPLRVLDRLGVTRGPQAAVRLEWTAERRLAADGRALEYVQIELPADAAGEYRLEVVIREGGREAVAVRRLVIVAPEGAGR